MKHPQQEKNRREMFRTSARWLALGGIGLLSGGLIVRGSGKTAECRQSASCHDCATLARCTLPPAMTARNNKR